MNSAHMHELIDTAAKLDGVVRNAGTHAAGVVISDIPLVEYIPLHRPTRESEDSPIKTVTQFEVSILDELGLLKVDFLGLATLTVMANACKMIEKRHGIHLDLENIPLDDAETFKFLGKGLTAGVFQLEGGGMTKYLMQMKPKNLANIIAMVALYRPGPMEFIPKYIACMHGKQNVEYRHEMLKPILEETYGIAVYQEQIMSAAMALAGYSAADADALRKAISKKNEKQIKEHEKKFIEGAVKNGIDEEAARLVFEDWKSFAQYGFNKSHAADYGIIAVQTAYLKTHYPLEYMTALLCSVMSDSEKIALYIVECQTMGIAVLPPDVNHSDWNFSIEEQEGGKNCIRFGLGAIKNVGQAPVEMIVSARREKPFEDLDDFIRRVDLRKVGKRTLECLIRVGALDAFGERNALFSVMDRMVAISESHFKAKEEGQLSFFGSVEGLKEEIKLPALEPLDKKKKMAWEKELLGLFLTDHPLSEYMKTIQRSVTHYSAQLKDAVQKEEVIVAGRLTNIRSIVTKKGEPMGFANVEDVQGSISLVIFPRTWAKAEEILVEGEVVLVKGKVDLQGEEVKVLVAEMRKLENDEGISEGADLNTHLPLEEELSVVNPVEEGERGEVKDDLPTDMAPDVFLDPQINSEDNLPTQEEMDDFQDRQSTRLIAENVHPTSPLFYTPAPGKRLTIVIKASGKKEQDMRLLKQVYGMLHASPGSDRFTFLCKEGGKEVALDFPNDAISITDELLKRVNQLVGEENVHLLE